MSNRDLNSNSTTWFSQGVNKDRFVLPGQTTTLLRSHTQCPLFLESHFGAEEDGMQELEDRTGRDVISEPSCNEYGVKCNGLTDDVDDDDEDETLFEGIPTLSLETLTISKSSLGSNRFSETEHASIFLLGKTYHAIHDYAPRRDDETSLFWFTYRFDFPEIVPYRITTDAGWGCMLRSAQMMLAQALRMHYKGRQWRPPLSLAQRRQDAFVMRILTWFADYPSKTDFIFSLHNMVAVGLAKYETLPGEWYGPSKASYVIRDLCAMLEDRQAKEGASLKNDMNRPIFRIHVAPQGAVYRDAINALMTKNQSSTESNADHKHNQFQSHPLDPTYSEISDKLQSTNSVAWESSLLLLIPLRLGLQYFNQDYVVQLAHTFSFPQSVGILGGRPRGARWFYGATSDGAKLYGLDPHTIQPCPERRKAILPKGQTKLVVSLSSDYLRSVHTTNPECINLNRLDPSLTLGFYCRDHNDFLHLCKAIHSWESAHPSMPKLFSIADCTPDYTSNSTAMDEMLSMSLADGLDGDENDVDDDEEYVLL